MMDKEMRAEEHSYNGQSTNAVVEWCLGLPLVGQRPLAVEERAALGQEAKQLKQKGCLLGCSAPLLFLVPFFGLAFMVDWLEGHSSLAGVGTFLFLCLLLPAAWLFLRSNDALKASKGFSRDVRAGYLKQFQGLATDYEGVQDGYMEPPEPQEPPRLANAAPKLAKAQSEPFKAQPNSAKAPGTAAPIPAKGDGTITLEVLPASQLIWRINGNRPANWRSAPTATVAAQPAFAQIAAQWLEPAQASTKEHLFYGQRELSREEQQELREHIAKLWWRPVAPALLLNSWLGLPLLLHFMIGLPITLKPDVYFLIGCTLWVDYNLVMALLHSKRLTVDLEHGSLLILRWPDSSENTAPSESKSAGDSGAKESQANRGAVDKVVEILPISQWHWTHNGKPAKWRKARS